MKKGEKRIGDYVVTLHSDKKCYMCGQLLRSGTTQTRIYMEEGFSYYFCYDPNGICMNAMMGDLEENERDVLQPTK